MRDASEKREGMVGRPRVDHDDKVDGLVGDILTMGGWDQYTGRVSELCTRSVRLTGASGESGGQGEDD